MNNIQKVIKEIRKNHNLTQKQFAKKFFISEKTVSNYENGLRTPDIEFLVKLSKEFNISLDYFVEKGKNESDTRDLIVSARNHKLAIFDTKQGVYLTQHVYDSIYLSPCGKHIVSKNDGYNALVDNRGNVKEFADYNFVYKMSFENEVMPVECKKDKKMYLIDEEGNKRSVGFDDIYPANSNFNLGLYVGRNYADDAKHEVKEWRLLYKNGKILPYSLEKTEDGLFIKDAITIEKTLELIDKYGTSILLFVPRDVFKLKENYLKIVNHITSKDFADKNKNSEVAINFALQTLTDIAKKVKAEGGAISEEEALPEENFNWRKNKLSREYLKKEILKLYERIGLI